MVKRQVGGIVSELPIGLWSDKFKEKCEEMCITVKKLVRGKEVKTPPCLKSFENSSTQNTCYFRIKPMNDFTPDMNEAKNPFRCLITSMKLSNMVALDKNGYPRRYKTPEEMIEYFCEQRLEIYQKRKNYLIPILEHEYISESNRYRFVKLIVLGENGKKLIMNQKDDKLEADMLNFGLKKLRPRKLVYESDIGNENDTESFEYLLSMQMRSMTKNKLDKLKEEIDKIENDLNVLKGKTPKDIWLEDLDKFEKKYPKYLSERNEDPKKKKKITKSTNTTAPRKRAVKK